MEQGHDAHREPTPSRIRIAARERVSKAIDRLRGKGYVSADLRPIFEAHRQEIENTPDPYVYLKAELEARLSPGPQVVANVRPKPTGLVPVAGIMGNDSRRQDPHAGQDREPRTRGKGRGPVPWGWFQKAGFPVEWLKDVERELLRIVYQVHTAGMGWGKYDWDKDTREGVRLLPKKLAPILGYCPDTIRAARNFLVTCELLKAVEETPGSTPLVVLGWWKGPEAENLAALRDCYSQLRAIRRRRPLPGKRKKGGRNGTLSQGDSKGDSQGKSQGDSHSDSKGLSQGDSQGGSQGGSQGKPWESNQPNTLETHAVASQKSPDSPRREQREKRERREEREIRETQLGREGGSLKGEGNPLDFSEGIDWAGMRNLPHLVEVRKRQQTERGTHDAQ